jgi:hypothetical protein
MLHAVLSVMAILITGSIADAKPPNSERIFYRSFHETGRCYQRIPKPTSVVSFHRLATLGWRSTRVLQLTTLKLIWKASEIMRTRE